MKLYDTKSTNLIEFNEDHFDLYACGPTVYNYIHIGNARPVIMTDVLVRFMEYNYVDVNYLLNITDIDDKIIAEAIATNLSENEVAEYYTEAFLEDLNKMNIRMPNKVQKISKKINEIVDFIDKLILNGSAYQVNGNVYFDVEKFRDEYGAISKQTIEDLRVAARVSLSEDKKNPSDFTLWKQTTEGKQWMTKWCKGRPGWHTECVVLIDDYFNKMIDCHVGGIDLKFPHHENERIQSIAINNRELAKSWMHVGHVNLDGSKMSKSKGNTIVLRDFLKEHQANVLRYIFLNTSYTQPINITDEVIEQGHKWVEKIYSLIKKINWSTQMGMMKFTNTTPIDEDLNSYKFFTKFIEAMNDDLNTAQAITIINEMVKHLNKQIKSTSIDKTYEKLIRMIEVLGFKFDLKVLKEEEKELIGNWQSAVLQKNFEVADSIRDELLEKGII